MSSSSSVSAPPASEATPLDGRIKEPLATNACRAGADRFGAREARAARIRLGGRPRRSPGRAGSPPAGSRPLPSRRAHLHREAAARCAVTGDTEDEGAPTADLVGERLRRRPAPLPARKHRPAVCSKQRQPVARAGGKRRVTRRSPSTASRWASTRVHRELRLRDDPCGDSRPAESREQRDERDDHRRAREMSFLVHPCLLSWRQSRQRRSRAPHT
jgi:hypothetical protein